MNVLFRNARLGSKREFNALSARSNYPRKMKRRLSAIFVYGAIACATPLAARASVLGEKSTATPSSRVAGARAAAKATAASWTMQELRDGDMVTHEYSTADGVVFGVAWDGPMRPDVPALLGQFFDEYKGAEGRASGDRRAASVATTDGVQAVSAGSPGHFFGRALARKLAPAGFQFEDLK